MQITVIGLYKCLNMPILNRFLKFLFNIQFHISDSYTICLTKMSNHPFTVSTRYPQIMNTYGFVYNVSPHSPDNVCEGSADGFDLIFDAVFLAKCFHQRRHFVQVVARHGREQTERNEKNMFLLLCCNYFLHHHSTMHFFFKYRNYRCITCTGVYPAPHENQELCFEIRCINGTGV